MNCFCKQCHLHSTYSRTLFFRVIRQLQQRNSFTKTQLALYCCQLFFIVFHNFASADDNQTTSHPPKNYGLNQLLIPPAERCHIGPETENLPAAVAACELAANNGEPEAQYLLGHLYYQGIVVDLDHEHAKYWYEQASLQGHSKAQYQLAFMYYQGIGLNQDYTQAYIMMKMAAVNGYEEAVDFSDKINSKLSQEQRAMAFYTLSQIFQLYANQLQAENGQPASSLHQ
ncbi:tetratricopeptide repeat protein [Spartinivicinus ruber]|uniref:tetratricopeptide repeat protein n=1 Tax=Spartinivicinus ruber TaxID=2683272 RepID=UPI0013D5F638|nr:tetratricopeptide repeat protein [Spartinivicinus ruber]